MIKRGLLVLLALGALGWLAFFLTALVMVTTGHENDPIPLGWIIEIVASLGAVVIGGGGYIVADLIEGY